jgi:uncharacterized protein
MTSDGLLLERIIAFLSTSAAVVEKVAVRSANTPALAQTGQVRLGDDCAVVKEGEGYLLLAAEGMLPSFVADDPWFAGYSAVMVNVSDVAAMGGKALAIVDVLCSPGTKSAEAIWEGLNAAAKAYGVPIAGGHTTASPGAAAYLAAAVMGRADRLITSFDAAVGDDLIIAVDLRGAYRGGKPFWNASSRAPAERLREDLEILPALAATGACHAGKDISNGGIPGTLAMLLECSRVGVELALDRLPRPNGVQLDRWLISFPSYGFVLTTPPDRTAEVVARFTERDIACAAAGKITEERSFVMTHGTARRIFLDVPGGGVGSWRPRTKFP